MKTISIKKAMLLLFSVAITTTLFSQTNQKKVIMEKVVFKNNEIKMSGNLYYPENMDRSKKYSAIICVNPAGAVKEQSAGLYAKKMAQNGFITLAFDASHQGESGGEPRYLEDPYQRIEDIRTAVDYLTTLPNVNQNQIGAIGLCAGAGYSISAAMTERRIKAIAGVSGTDAGAAIREGWSGNTPVSEQIKLLEAVARQRTAEANGAAPVYGTYVPETIDDSMPVTMREANDYYRTSRAGHPNSENKVLMRSLDKILSFSAYQFIETLLTQPLLMIAGSKSDALYLSEQAVNRANCDKELFIIDGATHVDMYDVLVHVDKAVTKLTVFFKEKLSQ